MYWIKCSANHIVKPFKIIEWIYTELSLANTMYKMQSICNEYYLLCCVYKHMLVFKYAYEGFFGVRDSLSV